MSDNGLRSRVRRVACKVGNICVSVGRRALERSVLQECGAIEVRPVGPLNLPVETACGKQGH